jgi:hypothetical protein
MTGTHALVVLATILLAACGGGEGENDEAASEAPSPSPSRSSGDASQTEEGRRVRITFGDTALTARLRDNATARDLAAQLPLTLTFNDLNNVEKTGRLPRALSVEGAPEGDDPEIGDIGYWAPGANLVFYLRRRGLLERDRSDRRVRREYGRRRAPH